MRSMVEGLTTMLKEIAPKATRRSLTKARSLRGEMTLPEVLLWRELRKRPQDLRFRRQHPSGGYVLDFYCIDARLCVEVDGAAHDMGGNPARDLRRDAALQAAGVHTMRVPASELLRDVGAVALGIVAEALARLPLHHPALPGGPPPRDELGED